MPKINSLARAFRGVLFSSALQLSSRLLTFFINLMVARQVGPEMFGVLNVDLALLLTAVKFLVSETMRTAALRCMGGSGPDRPNLQAVITFAWLSVPLGIACTSAIHFLPLLFRSLGGAATHDAQPLHWAAILYFVAVAVEQFAEPLYILARSRSRYVILSLAEGASLVVKAIVQLVLIRTSQLPNPVAFGLTQLVYGCLYTAIMYGYFARQLRLKRQSAATPAASSVDGEEDDPWAELVSMWQLLPHFGGLRGMGVLFREAFALSWGHAVKWLMSDGAELFLRWRSIRSAAPPQGDLLYPPSPRSIPTILTTAGSSAAVSGVTKGLYSVVVNLGSLVCRCLLAPIEERAFEFFCRLNPAKAAGEAVRQREAALEQALVLFFKCALYLGLTVAIFGPPLAGDLIQVLYGARYAAQDDGPSAGDLLGWYCVLVFLMAINGVTEAAARALVPRKLVLLSNGSLTLGCVVYLGVMGLLFARFGVLGLIWANAGNMIYRIILSWATLSQANRAPPLHQVLPPIWVWVCMGGVAVLLHNFCRHTGLVPITRVVKDIAIAFGAFVGTAACTYFCDTRLRPYVAVCGGAGYIGSHVVRELLASGDFNIVVVDSLIKGHRAALDGLPVALEIGDVRDAVFLEGVFSRYHIVAVIHLCAFIEAGESMTDPLKFYHNNVYGGIILSQTMMKFGVKRLIFSSTAAIFGNPPNDQPISESTPKVPVNAYGNTKLTLEEMFRWCDGAHGMKTIALRYFNAAGAHPNGTVGEAHEPESHLIPLILQVALGKRSQIKIFGTDYPTADGTCIRDYIHVMDLASAHLAALRYLMRPETAESPITSDCFNLGTGTPRHAAHTMGRGSPLGVTGQGFSVRQVIEVARRVTGHPIPVQEVARRPGDPALLVASSEKARRVLGWQPRHTLESIVETAWRWHSSPSYARFLADHQ
ncbi:putative UDP-glucose 4-epimerase [Paratrimastix pyriformis]|uniref:UDP-glucose 4-epimerase n=1 Tax=Paratrimastix pyriformis TaxID=342808 RepID=A0ABQ8UY48_9EUKA|nr:putative UDP-glucose 4-epimerase [Paratrimastix pyriformis]